MRIGLILVGRNMEEYVAPCLAPWLEWRRSQSAHQLTICAVSVPFEGFPIEQPDRTVEYLESARALNQIDHLMVSDTPIQETAARGAALGWLVREGVDVVWMCDLDEHYTAAQIARIVVFVESTPFTTWYRISFKNAIFTPTTYLAEPFTPPRIYRVRAGAYRAHSFYEDNNIAYGGTITRDLKWDQDFPSMTIPKETAWIRHLSWLSDSRSRAKIEYQTKARGWSCSFRWDEGKGLCFNEDHFARLGQPLPEVVQG